MRLPDVGQTGSKPKTDKRERQINTKTKKLTSEFSNPVQPDQLIPLHFILGSSLTHQSLVFSTCTAFFNTKIYLCILAHSAFICSV